MNQGAYPGFDIKGVAWKICVSKVVAYSFVTAPVMELCYSLNEEKVWKSRKRCCCLTLTSVAKKGAVQ